MLTYLNGLVNGLHIHNIRAKGSLIRGTNGTSNGIVPMLKVFNNTARYIDQGGGRRNGSFAIYIEPHHADVEEFLDLKKNHGDEELRARDLFYALWVSNLFMERVKSDQNGVYFAPIRLLVYLKFMEKNLMNYMKNMSGKEDMLDK